MSACIKEDHEALLQFLYMAPIALVQTSLDGEILMANPLAAQLLMPLVRQAELVNLFTALEDHAPDLRHRVSEYAESHGMVCDALQLRVDAGPSNRKDTQYLSLSLLKLDEQRLMAVLADVTQTVKRDRELRQNQAWVHTLVTNLTEYALLSLDDRGHVRAWNPSIARVTGFQDGDTVGRSCAMFYPSDSMTSERVLDRLHEADRSGWSLDEGWRTRADGSRYWGSCLVAPLHAPDETRVEERAYSLIIRDVSDHREASEALWRSVSCDHLTGLANRRAFFEAAELELQRWKRVPRPLSVVMVDVDHFKAVNDSHGHPAGDAVLRHLAAGLTASFRAIDVVARLGGEEFIVLLPGTPVEGAEVVASRLCQNIAAQAVEVDGTSIRCTVSVGVATMDVDLATVEQLVKRADAAMYAAKADGRNRVVRWHADLARPNLLTSAAEAV